MNAEFITIKTAYEDEGMTPAEIAEDRDLDIVAVKAGLMSVSSKYRKDCGQEEENVDELNFSRDEQIRAKRVIMDLAEGAEDPHLRGKMACYVRDDAKGRKDVVKGMAGQQFNILYINEQMKKVREVASNITSKAIHNV